MNPKKILDKKERNHVLTIIYFLPSLNIEKKNTNFEVKTVMAPKTVRSLDIHIVNILKLTCTYYASFSRVLSWFEVLLLYALLNSGLHINSHERN